MKTVRYICFTVLAVLLPAAADTALATQAHGAPEGMYVHQFSHMFFIFAMGILIYWLRSRALVREPGWRYLQYACLFFLLWSVDAFCVHLLDEYKETNGNVTRTAKKCGLERQSLQQIMRRYNISAEDYRS